MSDQCIDQNGIGEFCFAECYSLKEIKIGKCLETIPKGCFYYCKNLRSVFIENLTTIEEKAFESCEQLNKIGNCSFLKVIGQEAFYNCKSLTNFHFPIYCGKEDELVIEKGAFSYSGIKELYLDCEKLTLGEDAFKYTDLTRVTIYSMINSLPTSLFFKCQNLFEVKLPEYLERIESNCFYGCINLKYIKFPQSLRVIGSYSFQRCLLLKEINLPESLTLVGEDAFSECPLSSEVIKALKQKC